jgi:hypothetical protein
MARSTQQQQNYLVHINNVQRICTDIEQHRNVNRDSYYIILHRLQHMYSSGSRARLFGLRDVVGARNIFCNRNSLRVVCALKRFSLPPPLRLKVWNNAILAGRCTPELSRTAIRAEIMGACKSRDLRGLSSSCRRTVIGRYTR